MFLRLFSILLILSISPAILANCDDAVDLLYQAHELRQQGKAVTSEKWLVNMALETCPNLPEAHNYLASLLENEGNYSQAIVHYKKAIEQRPDFSQAWYGLGETYYKQGRFPLSLEAHLHACQTDKDSKARVEALLKSKDYTVTETGKIIDKESLLVIYDKQRRKKVDKMLSECGLRAAPLKPTYVFRNFQFDTGKATLPAGSERQVREIAKALWELQDQSIIAIHGHTDTQPFKDFPLADSDRLNRRLSEQRAANIATALIEQGIQRSRIETYGYGYYKPLINEKTPNAWRQNRRVEIKVD